MDPLSLEVAFTPIMGKPAWVWAAFLALIGFLLWLDLGVLNRGAKRVNLKKALLMWAGFASVGVAFGFYIWGAQGQQKALEYYTGYLLETTLALDNIFVIATIFSFFAIPPQYQHRILFWGIIGAVVMRGIMIGAGAALVHEFDWVLLIFAAFLLFTGLKMLAPHDENEPSFADSALVRFIRKRFHVTDDFHGERFFVRLPSGKTGKLELFATPCFLALLMVELADVVFAVDSVPAIFAVTTDPYIVYTSNIFAILGLRSMYFLLAEAKDRFRYLKPGLAILLVLIGVKILWTHFVGKVDPLIGLCGTIMVLGGAIIASLIAGPEKKAALPQD